MSSFYTAINNNAEATKWFSLLNDIEKTSLIQIFDKVIDAIKSYNEIFFGFELYITGSSLNLITREYNDIDLMIIMPVEEVKKTKSRMLENLYKSFLNKNLESIQKLKLDPRIKLLGLIETVNSILDHYRYFQEVSTSNNDVLLQRLGSTSELTRILRDPESELAAIKVRVEGILEAEKNILINDSDGVFGYQFGPFVEELLKDLSAKLSQLLGSDGQPLVHFEWHKSFSEGYGKVAGENNVHVYPKTSVPPVHIFITTAIDFKKAMEKKESFMLEYYSDSERMKPIKLV